MTDQEYEETWQLLNWYAAHRRNKSIEVLTMVLIMILTKGGT